jgi:hypothetical protein
MLMIQGVRREGGSSWLKEGAMAWFCEKVNGTSCDEEI